MKSLDTLYCPHQVADNELLHLWHARPGVDWKTRRWIGQQWSPANTRLAQRYVHASGEPGFMTGLVGERPRLKPVKSRCVKKRRCYWWCWFSRIFKLGGD
jgi:hypothetical protein